MRHLAPLSLMLLPALLALAGCRCAPRSTGPHVVLVIGCTLRADQLSPYGGDARVTPTLQALADQGVRFEHTIAQGSWTRPATAALITGRSPTEQGMAEPGAGFNDRALPADAVTLAERFAAAGYTAVGVTGNPNLSGVFGMDQGLLNQEEPAGTLWRDTHPKVRGEQVVEAGLALLEEHAAAGPVYLRLMLVDSHTPFRVRPAAVDALRPTAGEAELPEKVLRYRAALQQLDGAVAALDAGLSERGFGREEVLLVVVGDHGEGLGWPEGRGKGHGTWITPDVAHVPWLMRGPGVPPGHVVSGLSAGIDVAPTVLALAGVEASDLGPGLAGAAQGHQDSSARSLAFIDTWFRRNRKAAVYSAGGRICEIDFAERAMGAPPWCYDGWGTPNLTGDAPSDADLAGALRGWHGEQVAGLEAAGALGAGQRSDALDERLRALGYIE